MARSVRQSNTNYDDWYKKRYGIAPGEGTREEHNARQMSFEIEQDALNDLSMRTAKEQGRDFRYTAEQRSRRRKAQGQTEFERQFEKDQRDVERIKREAGRADEIESIMRSTGRSRGQLIAERPELFPHVNQGRKAFLGAVNAMNNGATPTERLKGFRAALRMMGLNKSQEFDAYGEGSKIPPPDGGTPYSEEQLRVDDALGDPVANMLVSEARREAQSAGTIPRDDTASFLQWIDRYGETSDEKAPSMAAAMESRGMPMIRVDDDGTPVAEGGRMMPLQEWRRQRQAKMADKVVNDYKAERAKAEETLYDPKSTPKQREEAEEDLERIEKEYRQKGVVRSPAGAISYAPADGDLEWFSGHEMSEEEKDTRSKSTATRALRSNPDTKAAVDALTTARIKEAGVEEARQRLMDVAAKAGLGDEAKRVYGVNASGKDVGTAEDVGMAEALSPRGGVRIQQTLRQMRESRHPNYGRYLQELVHAASRGATHLMEIPEVAKRMAAMGVDMHQARSDSQGVMAKKHAGTVQNHIEHMLQNFWSSYGRDRDDDRDRFQMLLRGELDPSKSPKELLREVAKEFGETLPSLQAYGFSADELRRIFMHTINLNYGSEAGRRMSEAVPELTATPSPGFTPRGTPVTNGPRNRGSSLAGQQPPTGRPRGAGVHPDVREAVTAVLEAGR